MKLFILCCSILVFVNSHAHFKKLAHSKSKRDHATAGCPFFGEEFTNPTTNETQKIDCSVESPHERAERLGTDPDPGQKTLGGCTCKSVCGATVEDGFNCDWCKTTDKCGSYSYAYGGWWDFCSYPSDETYEAQDYNAKSSSLWAKVTADLTSNYYPNVLGLLSVSIQTSFDDMWDVMPAGRLKYIHSVGAVCLINFEVDVAGYTGIFKKGSSLGFLRMGSATDVGGSGMVPGNGFKFLRTGNHSADWVTLFDLNGQKTWNFFKNNQTNHIGAPSGATAVLAKKFEQASGCASAVGLSDAARVDQDGTYYENPVFPFMLKFVPTQAAKDLMDDSQETDTAGLIKSLSKIQYHFHLFDVYAQSSPTAEEELIGTMTTATPCYPSKFGDEKLLFRHQRIEEDFQYKPEWLNQWDPMAICGNTDIGTTPPARCIDKPVPPSASILKKKTLQN